MPFANAIPIKSTVFAKWLFSLLIVRTAPDTWSSLPRRHRLLMLHATQLRAALDNILFVQWKYLIIKSRASAAATLPVSPGRRKQDPTQEYATLPVPY